VRLLPPLQLLGNGFESLEFATEFVESLPPLAKPRVELCLAAIEAVDSVVQFGVPIGIELSLDPPQFTFGCSTFAFRGFDVLV